MWPLLCQGTCSFPYHKLSSIFSVSLNLKWKKIFYFLSHHFTDYFLLNFNYNIPDVHEWVTRLFPYRAPDTFCTNFLKTFCLKLSFHPRNVVLFGKYHQVCISGYYQYIHTQKCDHMHCWQITHWYCYYIRIKIYLLT
jgi:hypothetical protein